MLICEYRRPERGGLVLIDTMYLCRLDILYSTRPFRSGAFINLQKEANILSSKINENFSVRCVCPNCNSEKLALCDNKTYLCQNCHMIFTQNEIYNTAKELGMRHVKTQVESEIEKMLKKTFRHKKSITIKF